MRVKCLAATLVLAASLAGCESAYVPPTSGDMAHMTFKRYKDSTTGIQTYDQAQTCTSRHNIALLNSDPQKSVTVAAGAPLSLTMSVDRAVIPLPIGFVVRGCNPTVTFDPKRGASYIAEVVTSQDICSIKITQVEADAKTSDVPTDEIKVRKWKRGFDASSSFCD